MKALIDPTSPISVVTLWAKVLNKYYPITTTIHKSAKVCQVEADENVFGVADVLFWQDCPDEIIAGVYYFDTESKEFILAPHDAPYPDQPIAVGTQTI